MVKKLFSLILCSCISTCLWAQAYTLQDKWVPCGNGTELLDPYYSNGVTFEWSGSSRNGKAHGQGVATKYLNGKLHSRYEGTYKNGIREGKGTFSLADGSVKKGTFVNGQLVGHGSQSDENGNTYEGEFLNYCWHGNGKLRHANGSTFEGFFVSDAPYTGKWTMYTGDILYMQKGSLVEKIQETHSSYSPKLNKRVTEYFDETWQRCQPKDAAYYRLVTYSAPNTPKGAVKDYYISGELQSEQYPIYIDYADEGKTFLEGEQTFYHKNGQVKAKSQWLNNQLNGPVLTYYPDGSKESEVFYVHGELHGDMIAYYNDGKIARVAKYENGQLLNNKDLHLAEEQIPCLVYNENFERNRQAWEYQGQNGIVLVNDETSISLQANPERTVSGGIYTGFSPMSTNSISIITNQHNPGEGALSLLFGYKDWNNFCAFTISGDAYKFTYKKNGVTVQDDNWKRSSAIRPDINLLTVANIGDKIKLIVNDEPVAEIGRIYYDGSLCGISLHNPSAQPIVADAAQLIVNEYIALEDIPTEYLPTAKNNPDAWKGNGSGFFLTSNGYIATNNHVVDDASVIQVNFTRNGKAESYPATVVITDAQNDLAIIKVNDPSFTDTQSIPYGLLTRTKDTGSEVFAMGYPIADVLGSEVKFTDGKISSKSGIRGDVRVYQISVPIQPGNSGGPLFDTCGNVIGITSSGLNRDYFKAENVNYAIKATYLKTLMEACPEKIVLEERNDMPTSSASLTDRIKQYEDFVVLVLTK